MKTTFPKFKFQKSIAPAFALSSALCLSAVAPSALAQDAGGASQNPSSPTAWPSSSSSPSALPHSAQQGAHSEAYSFCAGIRSSASGGGVAVGARTEAQGEGSVALGADVHARGQSAIALGNGASASGSAATALGHYTNSAGVGSLAAGQMSGASGVASSALGWKTHASGTASTALGAATTAKGLHTAALGTQTIAQAFSSLVIGQLNIAQGASIPGVWNKTDDLFVIGNGTMARQRYADDKGGWTTVACRDENGNPVPNQPSNALVVKKSGDTTVYGRLTVGTPQGSYQADPALSIAVERGDETQPATITQQSSEPGAQWVWTRKQADEFSVSDTQAMKLDAANRLILSGTAPAVQNRIILDPNSAKAALEVQGGIVCGGGIRVAPQGDLSMGPFTAEPAE